MKILYRLIVYVHVHECVHECVCDEMKEDERDIDYRNKKRKNKTNQFAHSFTRLFIVYNIQCTCILTTQHYMKTHVHAFTSIV